MAVPTIKAKVKKVRKPRKRKSKGVRYPWELQSVKENGFHSFDDEFKTEAEADRFIKENPYLIAPRKIHIEIAPVEY